MPDPMEEFRVNVLALPGWAAVVTALTTATDAGLVSHDEAAGLIEEWAGVHGQQITRVGAVRMLDQGLPDLAAAWAALGEVVGEMPARYQWRLRGWLWLLPARSAVDRIAGRLRRLRR